MTPDERIAKSYVWHKGQCYFISTIERDSSAVIEPPCRRYAETIAWEFDWDANERGEIVGQSGCSKHVAVMRHMRIAEHLALFGEFPEEEA